MRRGFENSTQHEHSSLSLMVTRFLAGVETLSPKRCRSLADLTIWSPLVFDPRCSLSKHLDLKALRLS